MRRWPNLTTRRGRLFDGFASSPVPAIPPPPVTRQARSANLRFGARLLPSARRRFDPAWPQANQGVSYPLYLRQAGSKPRPFGASLRRGKFWTVSIVLASPPPPVFMEQAGVRPRSLGAKLRRGVYWGPNIPQGNQGTTWVSPVIKGRASKAVRVRKGNVFYVPSITLTTLAPSLIRASSSRRNIVPRRGRILAPVIPQGNLGTPWPVVIRSRHAVAPRLAHGRFQPVVNNVTIPVMTSRLLIASYI